MGPGVHVVGTFMHVLPEQYCPPEHERPHAPQLLKSVVVLMHEVPHSVRPLAQVRGWPPAAPPPIEPPPEPPPTAEPPPAVPAPPPPMLLGMVHRPLLQVWVVEHVRHSLP